VRKSPFLLFPEDFPALDFRCTTVWRNLLRRLLRLLPFCGTIVFDNAYPYLWFVRRAFARHHAACRTVDTKPRRGILADDPVSDRFGRRRWLRPLRGCGKGGAVEFLGEVPFVRTERWGIGGFRYHWLCSMFRTLSQPLPVPENGTFSLSRAQSRTCSGYAEARKRRMKFNVFVKPNEQSRACASYAEAGKRQLKTNEPFR